jgi:hypothetical protein
MRQLCVLHFIVNAGIDKRLRWCFGINNATVCYQLLVAAAVAPVTFRVTHVNRAWMPTNKQ